jgi:hypothetical protein
MAERQGMHKPARTYPRPLADLVGRLVGETFARQGFASTELVTHWPEIVGQEVAAHSEPVKLQWPQANGPDEVAPATLVLRVEGPAAIEIQHLAPVILERVNRFLGWRAVAKIALRQAPILRTTPRPRPTPPSEAETMAEAASLGDIGDEALRGALARLGAAIKRK